MAGISTVMRKAEASIDEALNSSGLAPCILVYILERKIYALKEMDERMYAMEQQEEDRVITKEQEDAE